MHSLFDVIIIGAGPAGLSVAIEAHKAKLTYCVIDKGGIVHAIQNFPTNMTFFSTPELLEIGELPFTSAEMRPTRAEGIEYYIRVSNYFTLHLKLYEAVTSIKKEQTLFTIQTTKETYQSRNVVIATGYYDNPNLLNIAGEELPKVSHFYREPYSYFQQNVAVIGGKNSAAIAALELFRHGAHVTLIHRGATLSEKIKYWILPDITNRIKEGSIQAFFNSEVKEILPDSIVIQNANSETVTIANNFVFALTGYHPDYSFFTSCGIELESITKAPVHNPETFETNIGGLFVAGSVVAGKNNNKIFIENGRTHGKAIVDSITLR